MVRPAAGSRSRGPCRPRGRDYPSRTTPEVTATAAPAGEILVALAGEPGLQPAVPESIEAELSRRFPRHGPAVLLARPHGGEVALVPAREAAAVPPGPAEWMPRSLPLGGVPARESAVGAVLREGVRRGAAAVALLSSAPRDGGADWLGALLAPVLEDGFDYVHPTYTRPATDGMLNTGIVYPLTRALYGKRLRQPLGAEACLSPALARLLVDDPDWRRDPEYAGCDAWLVAKVLAGKHRACQAWLGAMPREPGGAEEEDVSRTLARVLGPVFREMERHAVRWQRVDGSQPLPAFGAAAATAPGDPPPHATVDRLVEAFRVGQSDLAALWALVLPPATMLALRRAARAGTEAFRIDDATWARAVYDFAVAYHVKSMERGQLLAAFTPLYLGWVGSFLHEVYGQGPVAADARVEALCAAFEHEKPYLIGRWRWPDGFSP